MVVYILLGYGLFGLVIELEFYGLIFLKLWWLRLIKGVILMESIDFFVILMGRFVSIY